MLELLLLGNLLMEGDYLESRFGSDQNKGVHLCEQMCQVKRGLKLEP